MKTSLAAIAVSFLLVVQSLAQESIDVIKVVGQSPLGTSVDAGKIASNVQKATGEQMREQRAVDLADFMKRNLASVFVNEAQNNPL